MQKLRRACDHMGCVQTYMELTWTYHESVSRQLAANVMAVAAYVMATRAYVTALAAYAMASAAHITATAAYAASTAALL